MQTVLRCKWNAKDDKFIVMNAGKLSTANIAKHLRRTESSVASRAHRLGVSLLPISASEHDKWLCRELYKEGLTIETIAEKMELSNRKVSNIVFNHYC
ncbi:hypothetical protein GW742_18000 [Citrobacter freundii]|nr:hypothetical protein [Citrobacter freundii]MBC6508320.1 hypothetical protein [Citrobacter freundii]